jgi:hypothetical protein
LCLKVLDFYYKGDDEGTQRAKTQIKESYLPAAGGLANGNTQKYNECTIGHTKTAVPGPYWGEWCCQSCCVDCEVATWVLKEMMDGFDTQYLPHPSDLSIKVDRMQLDMNPSSAGVAFVELSSMNEAIFEEPMQMHKFADDKTALPFIFVRPTGNGQETANQIWGPAGKTDESGKITGGTVTGANFIPPGPVDLAIGSANSNLSLLILTIWV